jgi:hypothetical protein
MRLSSWLRSARSLFVPSGTEKGLPTQLRKRAVATPLSVERLEERTVPSTFTVRNLADSGPGTLRQAVLDANANPGPDVIRFAHAARDGTIALTGGQLNITDNLTIDGPGAERLAVSGNDVSRVFQISPGVAVSIDALTVTHGHALLRGGGILNAGTLTLSDAVVSDNQVVGLPGVGMGVDAFGGGILNTGALTVSHTRFADNRSNGGDGLPGGPGSAGLGGAIMSLGAASAPATATVSHSTFFGNQAAGGAAGAGSPFTRNGLGGAIMNDAGTFTVSHSLFLDNQAVGGFGGGPVSFGAGGAISNVALVGDAILSVSSSLFLDNRAIGGATGTGTSPQSGRGGAIANFVAGVAPLPVTVTATATVTDSVLLDNQAIGGAGATGGNGGTGQGGGIVNLNGGILTVTHSALVGNLALGGAGGLGGNGGNGLGGGVFNGGPNPFGTPSLTLDRSLVVLNRADGGAAGDGGSAGLGQGGGLYLTPGGTACADLRTAIFANHASTSDDDVFGSFSTSC